MGSPRKPQPAPAAGRAAIEARRAALREIGGQVLGPMLVEAFDDLIEKADEREHSGIKYFHALGTHIDAIDEAEVEAAAGAGKACKHRGHGSLSAALQLTRIDVQRARNLVKAYPGEGGLLSLLTLRRADGKPLTWDVVSLVVQPSVPADKRDGILHKACDQNWARPDVEAFLKGVRPDAANVGTGGRAIEPPKDLFRGLARWEEDNNRWSKYHQAVFRPEVLAKVVENTDPALLAQPDTVARIDGVQGQCRRVIAEAQAKIDQLDALKARLLQAPAPAVEVEAVAEADAPEADAPEAAAPPARPLAPPAAPAPPAAMTTAQRLAANAKALYENRQARQAVAS